MASDNANASSWSQTPQAGGPDAVSTYGSWNQDSFEASPSSDPEEEVAEGGCLSVLMTFLCLVSMAAVGVGIVILAICAVFSLPIMLDAYAQMLGIVLLGGGAFMFCVCLGFIFASALWDSSSSGTMQIGNARLDASRIAHPGKMKSDEDDSFSPTEGLAMGLVMFAIAAGLFYLFSDSVVASAKDIAHGPTKSTVTYVDDTKNNFISWTVTVKAKDKGAPAAAQPRNLDLYSNDRATVKELRKASHTIIYYFPNTKRFGGFNN